MRASWAVVFLLLILSACTHAVPYKADRLPDVMLGKWHSYSDDSIWLIHDNHQIDIYPDKNPQNIRASAKYIILDVMDDHSALLLARHDNNLIHNDYYYLFEVEGAGHNYSNQKEKTILKTRFCAARTEKDTPPLSFDQHKEKAKHLFYDCYNCAINELYYSKSNQVD